MKCNVLALVLLLVAIASAQVSTPAPQASRPLAAKAPSPATAAAPRPATAAAPRPAMAAAPRPSSTEMPPTSNSGHYNCSVVRCKAANCATGEKSLKLAGSCCETCQPSSVISNACKVTCRTPKCHANATLVKSEGACCACCRPKNDDSEEESHLPTADSAGLGSSFEERNCTTCEDASDDSKHIKVKLAFKTKDSFGNMSTVLKGDWQGVLSSAHSACNSHVHIRNMTMDNRTRTATITYRLYDNKCTPKTTVLTPAATIDVSAYTEDAPTVVDPQASEDASNSASAVCVSSVFVLVAALALVL